MKKKIALILSLFILISALSFVGCSLGPGGLGDVDYNSDVQTVLPEKIETEHFVPEQGKDYYTSAGLALWMSVNGEYMKMDYFSLDGSKRVYDNMYFYEGDYFYMVTDDVKELYAALGGNTDPQYAEEETEDGYEVQVNVKKDGIYKLFFDVDTLEFDLEYKAEIETPVYYTIKNCSIYTKDTKWVEMSLNPENEEEFCLADFSLPEGTSISFFNNLHVSHYNVTVDDSCVDRYCSQYGKTSIVVNVGGSYNVYINRKTYDVRLELCNPDTADYGCVYYDTDFVTLEPCEQDVPYVFRAQITADKLEGVPKFYSAKYKEYDLTVLPSEMLTEINGRYYFRNAGSYEVTVNLKSFEISVAALPE